MIVVTPIPINDAILTSSSVPEPDTGETLWSSSSAFGFSLNSQQLRELLHVPSSPT